MVVPPEGTVGTEASADIDITLNGGRSVPRGHHIPHLERKAGRALRAAGLVLANTDDLAMGSSEPFSREEKGEAAGLSCGKSQVMWHSFSLMLTFGHGEAVACLLRSFVGNL